MLTQNFENLLASILESSTVVYGCLPVRSVVGMTYYLTSCFSANSYSYPSTLTETFTTSATTAGISFGTGNTAPTKLDVNLESTITSGVSVTITDKAVKCDAPGAPYLEYTMTVTNTGNDTLTITEIGYKQEVNITTYPGGTSSSKTVCLIDRTVFNTPITIQAGDAGVIKYTLKTIPIPRSKSGINLVSFTWGSDEDVVAMIDAARLGTIDLQVDGGWQVGDARTIHLDAFTSGGDKVHAAQNIDIVITQFGDYNSCGSIFQFDFLEACAEGQRMNSSSTNVGGYSGSEMYTTSLPALVNALPTWLKDRLLTFDVLVSAGNRSSVIETITGNKLALRSEIEIVGNYNHSIEGEGNQVDWYKIASVTRQKRRGRTGSASDWWLRSPYTASGSEFCYIKGNGNAGDNGYGYAYATRTYGIAPFGCI